MPSKQQMAWFLLAHITMPTTLSRNKCMHPISALDGFWLQVKVHVCRSTFSHTSALCSSCYLGRLQHVYASNPG